MLKRRLRPLVAARRASRLRSWQKLVSR